jgi:retron-type reverse transcriptase
VHYELTVAALEDKIVQYAVGTVLNQIWEEDFLGFSYGFRPGRSQHDALDALWVGIVPLLSKLAARDRLWRRIQRA